jgi:AraC-like DNA-binding protein
MEEKQAEFLIMARKPPLPPTSLQVSNASYCFLGTSSAKNGELRLLMAGREVCSEEYQVVREGYPSLALELVTAGAGSLELKGRRRDLLPGTIFSYGPGMPHAIRTNPGKRVTKYFVNFTGREAETLMSAAGMMPGRVAMIPNLKPMVTVFDLILERGGRSSQSNAELCAELLRVILRMSLESVPLRSGKPRRDDCYARATALIDAEYVTLKSIASIARRIGVTPEHLSRTFREMGAEKPSHRLISKKMTHAAGLLLSGGWKVKQIAYELGYATQFHFSAVFKRQFGYSPRSLQQRMLKGAKRE